ncbi:dihydrofolate reductase family protein [Danxiaibacter flavus]|uniref:Dihydrofolate reductase family protein n=1 Tax=Danxiaibacter flavus TaxID=3049108 RepID=A0ABV3ZK22_9BACT|nr:dihydrofolate reductase family protein [Chitinophagaceae bacterium DXS]
MRKVIFQMLISLDGYYEGPDKKLDWHNTKGGFKAYEEELFNNADTLLFGRKTYELMQSFWPAAKAFELDPFVAGKMRDLQKIVFSRTLNTVSWENTRLIRDNIKEEARHLKNMPGGNILLLASSGLALTFMDLNLIDEFHILVNPVILGGGKTIFEGIQHRYLLQLINVRNFSSGNVLLCYKPKA